MQWRQVIADYFSFTRKERLGIVIILIIMLAAIFLPYYFSHRENLSIQSKPDSTLMAAINRLERKTPEDPDRIRNHETSLGIYRNDQRQNNSSNAAKPSQLFYFDPNTLSAEGWEKLGLTIKTIRIIQNYLAKGGRFKKPEDLRRVYGLKESVYQKLLPFIRIERWPDQIKTTRKEANTSRDTQPLKSTTFSFKPVDINTADTTALIQLPGIGSKLAYRIIHFRDKLGGFYSIDQVSETFGLPDSTFQKIRKYLLLRINTVKKLNLNTATVDDLKNHPYLKYTIANAIVAYRNEHGHFVTTEDLKKVSIVTEEVFRKIEPYLIIKN